MNRTTLPGTTMSCALAFAVSACQAPTGMPAHVPANALPPVVTAASDQIVGLLWQWQRTPTGAAPAIAIAAPDRYTLSFQPGGRVQLRADCNRGSASYEVNSAQLSFGAIALTRMMCPAGSQDTDFLRALTQVTGYAVDRAIDRNELVLTLSGGGSMHFRPAP